MKEDTTSTRAQMKQLWRYRGKVDWNTWSLPSLCRVARWQTKSIMALLEQTKMKPGQVIGTLKLNRTPLVEFDGHPGDRV